MMLHRKLGIPLLFWDPRQFQGELTMVAEAIETSREINALSIALVSFAVPTLIDVWLIVYSMGRIRSHARKVCVYIYTPICYYRE